jgi:GTP cyclohydrolase FolE2
LKEQRFLVDVGMRDLPFPMRVISKVDPDGQSTIANISVDARIMHEFEAHWIDKFIQIVHQHRERIGCMTLRVNIMDYLKELNATAVRIDFDYPFFIEKLTPLSKEKCLVRYSCTYSARASNVEDQPKILFGIRIPVITTYPGSTPEKPGGLFGQLSIVTIETESKQDVYPEDLVDLTDKHALSPVYSYLSQEDQVYLIQKIHSEMKTSVEMTDEIRRELARNRGIDHYTVRSSNFGMLHSYSTVISTERSRWVPFSGYEEEI